MAAAVTREIQMEADAFRSIQQEIRQNHSTRQRLLQQKTENELVLEELQGASEDATIYKLIGPALVKQEQVEATSNVKKRLEFIGKELDKLDAGLKSLQGRADKRRKAIEQLQKKAQEEQERMA